MKRRWYNTNTLIISHYWIRESGNSWHWVNFALIRLILISWPSYWLYYARTYETSQPPYYLTTKAHQPDQSLLTHPLPPSLLTTPGRFSPNPTLFLSFSTCPRARESFSPRLRLCVCPVLWMALLALVKTGIRVQTLWAAAIGQRLGFADRKEPLVGMVTRVQEYPVIPPGNVMQDRAGMSACVSAWECL